VEKLIYENYVAGKVLRQEIESVEIIWPSGRKQTLDNIKPNTVNLVHEEGGVESEPFESINNKVESAPKESSLGVELAIAGVPDDKPIVFVTTATWCASCKKNLPQVELLKKRFGEQFHFYGLPVDPEDLVDDLKVYEERFNPAYQILTSLSLSDRSEVSNLVRKFLGDEVLPSTIVTNAKGEILALQKGIPSVSELRKVGLKITSYR